MSKPQTQNQQEQNQPILNPQDLIQDAQEKANLNQQAIEEAIIFDPKTAKTAYDDMLLVIDGDATNQEKSEEISKLQEQTKDTFCNLFADITKETLIADETKVNAAEKGEFLTNLREGFDFLGNEENESVSKDEAIEKSILTCANLGRKHLETGGNKELAIIIEDTTKNIFKPVADIVQNPDDNKLGDNSLEEEEKEEYNKKAELDLEDKKIDTFKKGVVVASAATAGVVLAATVPGGIFLAALLAYGTKKYLDKDKKKDQNQKEGEESEKSEEDEWSEKFEKMFSIKDKKEELDDDKKISISNSEENNESQKKDALSEQEKSVKNLNDEELESDQQSIDDEEQEESVDGDLELDEEDIKLNECIKNIGEFVTKIENVNPNEKPNSNSSTAPSLKPKDNQHFV